MPSDKNIKFATLAVFLVMVLVAVLPFRLDRSTTALVRALRAELDQQQRLERVLDGLRDAESTQRGFVITGDAVLRAEALRADIAGALSCVCIISFHQEKFL